MLIASHIPIAVKATVKANAARFAQHAMPEFVRLLLVLRKVRQIPGLEPAVLVLDLLIVLPLNRQMRRGARPEFEHAMLLIRRNGLLGFHRCQLREGYDFILARALGGSQKMFGMARIQ